MQNLDIAKFGGTSVADYAAMHSSAQVIINNKNSKLTVVSACAGVTNILVELASGACSQEQSEALIERLSTIHKNIIAKLSKPEQLLQLLDQHLEQIKTQAKEASMGSNDALTDRLVSHGELLSSALITAVLNDLGVKAICFDIRKVMRTNSNFGCAQPLVEVVKDLCHEKLLPLLQSYDVVVTQGFIGSNQEGQTTTLGRGGSDYSAALLGEALNAATISIWTDVAGVYTSDPRLVPHAKAIAELSYLEAAEMATFGAKILHPSTLVPAVRHNIPVFVGSSKEPQLGGTWVRAVPSSSPCYRSVALRKNQTLITLASPKMVGASGFLAKVFSIFAKYQRSVDLVSTSEVSIAITLDAGSNTSGNTQVNEQMLSELRQFCHVKVEQKLSLVAIIGNNMSKQSGVTSKALNAIKDYAVRMICYGASNHNICFLLEEDCAVEALVKIHNDLLEQA